MEERVSFYQQEKKSKEKHNKSTTLWLAMFHRT